MKIVFMGTPDFAVGILDELVEQGVNVAAVITAPDRPSGRGLKVNESAVKKYAVNKGLKIMQPVKFRNDEFLNELKDLNADLFVVVAFRMLPDVVWQMPPLGTINLHASILPNYRGAAPINWAIINGEKETGVTTFFIEQEIDTGKVIEQEHIEIGENETAGELHDRLMELGKKLVHSSVNKIEAGTVLRTDQNKLLKGVPIKSAPKIFKPACKIDWSLGVSEVHNHCRGLSPYPTAWTIFEDEQGNSKSIKIFKTEKTDQPVNGLSEVLMSKTDILVPCRDFYLKILNIQPEGKRRMESVDYLAGHGNKKFKVRKKMSS